MGETATQLQHVENNPESAGKYFENTITRPNPLYARAFEGIGDQRKIAFLAYYAQYGVVANASLAAGISPVTHYAWLKAKDEARGLPTPESEEYAKAVEIAHEMFIGRLEVEAVRRATEGGESEKRIYDGAGTLQRRIVDRQPSDQLMTLLLKANEPNKYADRSKVDVSGSITVEQMLMSTWTDVAPGVSVAPLPTVERARELPAPAGVPASQMGPAPVPGAREGVGERASGAVGGSETPLSPTS